MAPREPLRNVLGMRIDHCSLRIQRLVEVVVEHMGRVATYGAALLARERRDRDIDGRADDGECIGNINQADRALCLRGAWSPLFFEIGAMRPNGRYNCGLVNPCGTSNSGVAWYPSGRVSARAGGALGAQDGWGIAGGTADLQHAPGRL